MVQSSFFKELSHPIPSILVPSILDVHHGLAWFARKADPRWAPGHAQTRRGGSRSVTVNLEHVSREERRLLKKTIHGDISECIQKTHSLEPERILLPRRLRQRSTRIKNISLVDVPNPKLCNG